MRAVRHFCRARAHDKLSALGIVLHYKSANLPAHRDAAFEIRFSVMFLFSAAGGTGVSARSVAVSYKPPMLVTRVRLPACALVCASGILLQTALANSHIISDMVPRYIADI